MSALDNFKAIELYQYVCILANFQWLYSLEIITFFFILSLDNLTPRMSVLSLGISFREIGFGAF